MRKEKLKELAEDMEQNKYGLDEEDASILAMMANDRLNEKPFFLGVYLSSQGWMLCGIVAMLSFLAMGVVDFLENGFTMHGLNHLVVSIFAILCIIGCYLNSDVKHS